MLERWILNAWYGKAKWTRLLLPIMWLYSLVVGRKRREYLNQPPSPVLKPVIVVGNITAGGTGKTPVVQALVRAFAGKGYKAAIITRGYGGDLDKYPHMVTQSDSPKAVGDEPYMMYQTLDVPIVVDPNRRQAAKYCCQNLSDQIDLIISDDGLQHYQLHRDIEICVMDAARGIGNGQLIPVGPLREPLERLDAVDVVLRNGVQADDGFVLEPTRWVNLLTGESEAISSFDPGDSVKAIAGIGNPWRFFKTLAKLNISATEQAYPDHHKYSAEDVEGYSGTLLMTEKDAVKIKPFATNNMWYLEVSAVLPEALICQLLTRLKRLSGDS